MVRTIAHISDLHIGRDERTDVAAAAIRDALVAADAGTVLLTGDVTHRGRREELEEFERIFAPVRERLIVVPGNHDRLGDDAASGLMPGARVQVASREGLCAIRLDSTAPHNRHLVRSHGELSPRDIEEVSDALSEAPSGAIVLLMLHHHVLPLPEDHLGERLATLVGWPHAAELKLGRDLVDRLRGRCDLVLHGHRPRASEIVVEAPAERPLRVLNAGSSPELGRVRVLEHVSGQLVAERWLNVSAQERPAARADAHRRARRAIAAA